MADIKNDEFSLSALPKLVKDQIFRKYEMSRIKLANEADENEFERDSDETVPVLGVDPLNNSTKSMLSQSQKNKLLANNSKKSASNKVTEKRSQQQQASESNSNTNVFDWDEYFDTNHRISTNQNIRLLSNQLRDNVSYAPRNISKSFASSAVGSSSSGSNLNGETNEAKKKRFEDKLNSYKDNRFQPYMLSDKSKLGVGGVGASVAAGNGSASASNSSTNLINQDMCIIANLNNFNNNVSNNINSSFINLTNPKKAAQNAPNYLIWDNNVIFLLLLLNNFRFKFAKNYWEFQIINNLY